MTPTHKLTRKINPAVPGGREAKAGTPCRIVGNGWQPGYVRIEIEWSTLDDPMADTRTETRDVPADAVADLHQIDLLGML